MFDSLKEWMNVPASIKPFLSYSGTGDKTFDDTVDIQCYPQSEIKVVRNNVGEEVVSNCQLYIDGSTEISDEDVITFDGKDSDIKAISTFYRDGKPDIKVVHL